MANLCIPERGHAFDGSGKNVPLYYSVAASVAALFSATGARRREGEDFNGPADTLVKPSIEAANISYNWLRVAAGHGIMVGDILMGAAKPAHILTPSATAAS